MHTDSARGAIILHPYDRTHVDILDYRCGAFLMFVCMFFFFVFFLCECSPFLFILRHKLVSFTGALRNAKVADNLLKIYIAPFFFVGRYLIYHYIFNFDMRLQAEFGASCLSIPLCPLVLELSCLNNLYHVGFWIPG